MFRAIWRLIVTLGVLGGMLILLFFLLGQIKAHAPAPISGLAAKAESLMQP